ncbi:BREX system ATP-binding domain-containing protein [Anaerocellum danielii]|uniref:BREX system ATP-binding domain-containing protein n=1 Tax=Anaerocellum danielii TaxID=1387557 RepID=UPI0005EB6473|nr:BREX system ATP-binding domain-containing protein [Caldicellulosiruptor danielii]
MQTINKDNLISSLHNIAHSGTDDIEIADLIDVGNKDYMDYLENEVIENLIAKGGATCKFIEGAYGAGKTHLLNLIYKKALEKGMLVACTNLDSAISLTDWKLVVEYILENVEFRYEDITIKSLPEILAFAGEYLVDSEQKKILKSTQLPSNSFKNAILLALNKRVLSSRTWEVIREYLIGRKVNVQTFKSLGITDIRASLSKSNAEYILKTILSSLHILGFKGVVLLFDENERTLSGFGERISRRNQLAANLMRRLVDSCSNGTLEGVLIVFSVLPDFISQVANRYEALAQRLQIVQGESKSIGWRLPLQKIDFVNTLSNNHELFMIKMVESYLRLAQILGILNENFKKEVINNCIMVLKRNVGSGYKRELAKTISTMILERMR